MCAVQNVMGISAWIKPYHPPRYTTMHHICAKQFLTQELYTPPTSPPPPPTRTHPTHPVVCKNTVTTKKTTNPNQSTNRHTFLTRSSSSSKMVKPAMTNDIPADLVASLRAAAARREEDRHVKVKPPRRFTRPNPMTQKGGGKVKPPGRFPRATPLTKKAGGKAGGHPCTQAKPPNRAPGRKFTPP